MSVRSCSLLLGATCADWMGKGPLGWATVCNVRALMASPAEAEALRAAADRALLRGGLLTGIGVLAAVLGVASWVVDAVRSRRSRRPVTGCLGPALLLFFYLASATTMT